MISFATGVRKCRKEGLWPVCIRLTLKREVVYLKTSNLVASSSVDRNGV